MTMPPEASPATDASPSADRPGVSEFTLTIGLYRDYQQIVDFRLPGVAVLGLDESAPLGCGWGPSPAHLLASALGACLGAALLHELRALGVEVLDMRTEVKGTVRADTPTSRHLANLAVRLSPVLARQGDIDLMPAPDDLADRSMIAGSIRTDLGLWVAITPEVQRKPRSAAHGARRSTNVSDVATPLPRFVEATRP